ncbi:hypothetical protein G9A89_018900 [Geosiphon pyriformis]|nr:hypothetical protein G9A89_018900 [Geosiphon pyriformis]
MNDILINNNKTVVISINCKVVAPFLSVSGAPISITKKEVLAKAHLDVQFFANLVLRKAILDKQFSYLVLAVLYSIVDYKIQFSFVSVSVCQKWYVLIWKSLKLKLDLLLDFSNNVLHHSSFYGLKTFEQIQAEDKIAAVVCFTNSVRILGQLFMHRSHDLQVLSWCPVHPLCSSVHISVNLLNNFLTGVVRVFFGSGLFLGNLMCNAFCFWCRTSLSGIFGESMYFRCFPSLCHYGIAFVEQLHGRDLIYMVLFLSDLLLPFDISMILVLLIVFGFSVYINGSLCNLESVNMKASAAAFFEDINLGLGIKVTGIVSFTLAELQAIVLALKCVPSSSSVHLFSDSQAALDVCKAELLFVLDNDWADLLAGISSYSGWLLHLQLKKCFVLINSSIVSGNSRHFELGSGAKIVDSCLFIDIDWFKLLSVVVHKHLYNKYYPSVMCLYCGNVEVLDHVFSCVFDATAWLQLFIDFAFAWRAISGLSHAFSYVLQMLSNCLTDLELVASLCKDFVLMF